MALPPKPDMPQMARNGAPIMPPMPNSIDSKLKENVPLVPSAKDSPLAGFIPGSNSDSSQLKRGDGDSVTIDGFILRLASNILTAGTNPFLNRLNRPKPQEVSTTPSFAPDPGAGSLAGNPVPELPPADPLEHVSLTGVMYNTKYPMALMTVGTEQVARMVKVGEKLTIDPMHSFQVMKIKPDSVELKPPGKKEKTRLIKISSIIGQSSNNNATQDAAYNAYTNPDAATTGRPGRNGSDLSNLSKLMDLTNSPVDSGASGFSPNGRN